MVTLSDIEYSRVKAVGQALQQIEDGKVMDVDSIYHMCVSCLRTIKSVEDGVKSRSEK